METHMYHVHRLTYKKARQYTQTSEGNKVNPTESKFVDVSRKKYKIEYIEPIFYCTHHTTQKNGRK